ncbi:DUF4347 domain-containing protein (plasmid) [Azospirillum brasilense]|uniref:DUF4347 domain-containing protein n=1 Tax=Azospirillum brasilense TaxID=192 RepID=A0A4D8QT80_AZOBR|nr:DUF4347 domain-containing protein [Azospirillum brasilense]
MGHQGVDRSSRVVVPGRLDSITHRTCGGDGAARGLQERPGRWCSSTPACRLPDAAQGHRPDAKVVLLDPQQEALGQMAKALSGMSGLDSVQVVSHGGEVISTWPAACTGRRVGQPRRRFPDDRCALRPGGDISSTPATLERESRQGVRGDGPPADRRRCAASSDDTGSGAGKNWTLEVKSVRSKPRTLRRDVDGGLLRHHGGSGGHVRHWWGIGFRVSFPCDRGRHRRPVILFSPTLVGSKVRIGDATTALQVITDKGLTINGDVDGDGIADIVLSGDNNRQRHRHVGLSRHPYERERFHAQPQEPDLRAVL